VTAKTITVGFPAPRDLAEAQEQWDQATGQVSGPPVDWLRVIRTIVDDVNARGGILGRTLKLSVWWYDTADYRILADYIAAECAHFTQDVEVFTVFVRGGDLETFECYGRHGMPVIVDWGNLTDDVFSAQNRNLFTISYPNLSGIARLTAHGLAGAGFLTPSSRIGVVAFDQPAFRRAVENVLKPALAARGISLTAEAYVTAPKTTEALGVMTTEVNGTVVRFRRDGVQKVLFLDHHTSLGWTFTRAAEAQQYRGFQYGLTSGSSPDARDESGERFLPSAQMEGAVTLGWAPLGDIPQAEGFELLPPPADRCRDLLEREEFRFDPHNCCNLWLGLEWCNRLWFLEAALEARGGHTISIDAFIRGAESLGSSFKSATAFGVRFGKRKHDGPSAYRVARWAPDCECFRYTSGPLPIP
jgi:hypothetical protein